MIIKILLNIHFLILIIKYLLDSFCFIFFEIYFIKFLLFDKDEEKGMSTIREQQFGRPAPSNIRVNTKIKTLLVVGWMKYCPNLSNTMS